MILRRSMHAPSYRFDLRGARARLAVICLVLAASSSAAAQAQRFTILDFATGSEAEDYLRVLQVSGLTPLYPWSIRGFSHGEISRLAQSDSAGPWNLRTNFNREGLTAGPLTLTSTFNSAYPNGANDGPVWAGRGLTVAVSGGIGGHLGPVSFAVAPVAFRAQNTAFPLLANGQPGLLAYNNGKFPGLVDLPQRFGPGPYSRLDPGASYLRIDTWLVTAGISTANEWIGPASEYPFLLGTNAPGFPHLFAGTGEPLTIGIGKLHARLNWGRLDQSDYSPVSGSIHYQPGGQTGTVRLATSGTFVFLPRGVPGLEVGVARFFHVPYTSSEPNAQFWKKPFKVLFLKNEYATGDSAGLDNQLASAFFRWALPHSGFEFYGERGYEDQFYDKRDLVEDPDHERAYMLGFQKTLVRPTHIDALKAEFINYQWPTVERVRYEGQVYLHGLLRQGHTNRGQLLGTSAGVGAAAASTVSWTRYNANGRTAVTLRRIVRNDRGDYIATRFVDPQATDVLVAAGVERSRFGKMVDLQGRLEAMQDYNRNFSMDSPNLSFQLTARLHR